MTVYVCPWPDCDRTFPSLSRLKSHFRQVHWPCPFCPVCGATRSPHAGEFTYEKVFRHVCHTFDEYHRALAYLVSRNRHHTSCSRREYKRRREAAHRLFAWPGIKFTAMPRRSIIVQRVVMPVINGPDGDGKGVLKTVEMLKTVASPRRVAILMVLARQPMSTTELCHYVYKMSFRKYSGSIWYHIRRLLNAGLITNRDDNWFLTKRGKLVLELMRALGEETNDGDRGVLP